MQKKGGRGGERRERGEREERQESVREKGGKERVREK